MFGRQKIYAGVLASDAVVTMQVYSSSLGGFGTISALTSVMVHEQAGAS